MLKKIMFSILIFSLSSVYAMWDHPGMLPSPQDEFIAEYIEIVKRLPENTSLETLSPSFIEKYRIFYSNSRTMLNEKLQDLDYQYPGKHYAGKSKLLNDEIENQIAHLYPALTKLK